MHTLWQKMMLGITYTHWILHVFVRAATWKHSALEDNGPTREPIESATVAHSTLTNGKESSSTYGLSRCEWGPSIISDVDGTRMGK